MYGDDLISARGHEDGGVEARAGAPSDVYQNEGKVPFMVGTGVICTWRTLFSRLFSRTSVLHTKLLCFYSSTEVSLNIFPRVTS
jgi:hypothetical protein